MVRSLALLLCASPVFAAGPVSVGIKGGVPLSDAFTAARSGGFSYVADTRRYTVGPELDINLPHRFAVEIDALYKSYHYAAAGGGSSSVTDAKRLEFPLLLKWRTSARTARPFVAAGMTASRVYSLAEVKSFFTGSPGSVNNAPAELNRKNNIGGVLAAGLEISGPLKFTAEVRYTRWGVESFRDTLRGLLGFNRNQAEFLLGIRF